jgi:uncharacterized repeat protein (TIGR03803 family)
MGNFRATAVRFATARQFSSFKTATELRPHVSQDVIKLLGFILISLFTLQLTGCGGSSSSPSPPSATETPTPTASPTPVPTPTASPTAAPTASPTPAYSVGGTVSGLSGGSLILINNETDALSVSSNGPFKFSITSSGKGVYSVLLATQPLSQVCTVANGSGVITNANITNVIVACTTSVEATLYAFSGGADGSYPDSGLTAGPDGNFYGTTTYGGANNLGTVYKLTPAGAHTVLYSFAGGPGDGQYPASGLELGNDGAFYVTTTAGGAFGLGTFFKITLDGTETMLYSFGGDGSGASPQGLTLLADGNFYGTTTSGGANNLGTVYKMTPAGVQTVLYSFAAAPDGQTPVAGLSSDSDGNLYGVTSNGGTDNFGTIFRIAPDGTGYATLHSFAGGPSDGAYPGTKLRNVTDGTLYGSTGGGGADGLGTIFKFDVISGVESVIHSFAGAPDDGSNPSCRLRVGTDGNLYGVSFNGGYFDLGTFFRITPAGMLTVLHSFAGRSDGQSPNSSLLVTSDGDFYGTTITGGPTNNGTIYKIHP